MNHSCEKNNLTFCWYLNPPYIYNLCKFLGRAPSVKSHYILYIHIYIYYTLYIYTYPIRSPLNHQVPHETPVAPGARRRARAPSRVAARRRRHGRGAKRGVPRWAALDVAGGVRRAYGDGQWSTKDVEIWPFPRDFTYGKIEKTDGKLWIIWKWCG